MHVVACVCGKIKLRRNRVFYMDGSDGSESWWNIWNHSHASCAAAPPPTPLVAAPPGPLLGNAAGDGNRAGAWPIAGAIEAAGTPSSAMRAAP
jgi:hypothetical protein